MRRILKFLLPILLGLSFSHAQEAKELAKHPGDVLKFEVKFTGPDADKVTSVSIGIGLKGELPSNQSGFNGGFGGSSNSPIAPGIFHIEAKIPDNIATGEFVFNVVSVGANPGSANYGQGKFEAYTFRVENPRTFSPPMVAVKELP